jgi:hypothetical protein
MELLKNKNPDYYRTVEEYSPKDFQATQTWTDSKNQTQVFSDRDSNKNPAQRCVLFSVLDSLEVRQVDGQYESIVNIPDQHVAIYASKLVLRGNIEILGGDVRIRCRTLIVPAEGASIDVSRKLNGYVYPEPNVAVPEKFGKPGQNGDDFAEQLRNQNKGNGLKGWQGGSIDIQCDEMQLEGALSLIARGSDGYPGVDGQVGGNGEDGEEGSAEKIERYESVYVGGRYVRTLVGYDYRIDKEPGVGKAGGNGGSAGAGGEGGDGGRIIVRVRTIRGETNLKCDVAGGQPGVPGKPGEGGKMGAGGWLVAHLREETSNLSQADPKDGADRPYARSGDEALPAQPGAQGDVFTELNANLPGLAPEFHPLFLEKYFQRILREYMFNSPQNVAGLEQRPALWDQIGDELQWLRQLLENYDGSPSDDSDSGLKQQTRKDANSLYLRWASGRTFLNDPPDYVHLVPVKILQDFFGKWKTDWNNFERHFVQMADDYEAKKKVTIDINQQITDQSAATEMFKQSRDYCRKQVGSLADEILSTRRAYTDAAEALMKSMKNGGDGLTRTIRETFNCEFSNIIRALEMMTFAHGSLPMAVSMGAVEAASLIDEAQNTIFEDNTKLPVPKGALISKVTTIGKDLQEDVRAAVTVDRDGTVVLDENKVNMLLADLQDLRDQVDRIKEKVDAAAFFSCYDKFESALTKKNDTILSYNLYVTSCLDYQQKYLQAEEKLTKLRNSEAQFDPADQSSMAYYTLLYQRELEAILRLVHWLRRKYYYTTLQQVITDEEFTGFGRLWTGDQSEAANANIENVGIIIENIDKSLTIEYYQTGDRHANFFPEKTIRSAIRIVIDEKNNSTLLRELRETGSLVFWAMPECELYSTSTSAELIKSPSGRVTANGVKITSEAAGQQVASKATVRAVQNPDELPVKNTANLCNIRATRVRPMVFGAATKGGQIRVEITQLGTSKFYDEEGAEHQFSHVPVSTRFIHRTNVREDGESPDDWGSDSDGSLQDAQTDNVSVFGKWRIDIRADKLEGDANYGLDLTQVSKIEIYFAGCYQMRAGAPRARRERLVEAAVR